MNRLVAASALALSVVTVIAWRPTPPAAAARDFVWLRGNDTLLRESVARTGDAISGDMTSGAQRVHYEGQLASSGGASRFEVRTTAFRRILHQVTIILRDDSAFVIEHSGRYDDTLRLASKAKLMLLPTSPVGLFEPIVQRARAQKTPRADVPVFVVSLDNADALVVVPFTVTFPSPDSAVVSVNGDEKVRFGIDAAGNIRGGASPKQRVTIAPSSSPLPPEIVETPPPVPAADPNDVKSADAIIAALYEANSIMVDQKRGADRFRSLYTPDARAISASHGLKSTSMMTRTIDDYVKAASSGPQRGGFREREIARTTESFGSIMQVFSNYESRRDSTDTHPTRGINSFQLFNDGHRWWIVSALWDAERANTPIPATYLKSRPQSQ